MAINCYTGLQGSGKSYEVVASVICPGLKNGRRIVTNIAGLDVDAIREYLEDQRVRSEDIREIVNFAYEDILKPGFFCRTDEKTHEHTPGTHVNAGDLVIVDEVWRFWGSGEKLIPAHLEFFRMHRHYTDVAGVSCDIAIITQDVGDLERKLKAVIESTFQMVKLKNLGRPKNYRIEIYTRANTRRKPQQIMIRKYDPKIFALYSSYDGKGGQEKVIDSRQNMLSGTFFRLILPLLVLGGIFAAWRASKVFEPPVSKTQGTNTPTPLNKSRPGVPGDSGSLVASDNPYPFVAANGLRIVGVVSTGEPNPLVTLEAREGTRIKTIVFRATNWKETSDGLEITYKGKALVLAEYEARSSGLVGHTGSEPNSKVPFSPQ